jgi:hypothetical protein
MVALALVLGARFAVFSAKASAEFREAARPYERYVAAVKKAQVSQTKPGEDGRSVK